MINAFKILVGRPEEKKPLERPRRIFIYGLFDDAVSSSHYITSRPMGIILMNLS
jgi:hypothetical protein